jgi:hypothetical protein
MWYQSMVLTSLFASECLQEPDSSLVKESLQVISQKLKGYFTNKMASEGKEGEDLHMSPEEIMATLQSMKEIIEDLQRRVQKTGEGESSVKEKEEVKVVDLQSLLHHHHHVIIIIII